MTDEEIKALIAEVVETRTTELQTQLKETQNELLKAVDTKNQGLAASLTKELKNALKAPALAPEEEKDKEKQKLSLQSIQSEMSKLREELKEKDSLVRRKTRDGHIRDIFGKQGVPSEHLETATRMFLLDNEPRLLEEEGEWFYKKGEEVKTVNDAVSEFITTPSGSLFLPASKTRGSSIREASVKASSKATGEKKPLNERLFEPLTE